MLRPSDVPARPSHDFDEIERISEYVDRHLRLRVFPCRVPVPRTSWTAASKSAAAAGYRALGWVVVEAPTTGVLFEIDHPSAPWDPRG